MSNNNWLKAILNFFWPLYCCSCGRDSFLLCDSCELQIKIRDKRQCPLCNQPQTTESICADCQSTTYLNKIIIATDYENMIIQKTIQTFKYQYLKTLTKPLTQILIKKFNKLIDDHQIDFAVDKIIVIPTPLHRQRQWERGFNQSAELGKIFAEYYHFNYNEKIIKRKHLTDHQAQLKREQRLKNVANCFQIENKELIQNKIIILVDDVLTTGATLNEQAKILNNAGADQVWGLIVAKNS